ncbi:MAG: hypothetical protein ACK4WF_02440 [Candidatus Brocadiales bacterium]
MAATWEQDFLNHLVQNEPVDVVKVPTPESETITVFYTISVYEGNDYDTFNKMVFRNALQVILGRGAEIDYPQYKNRQVVITLVEKSLPSA